MIASITTIFFLCSYVVLVFNFFKAQDRDQVLGYCERASWKSIQAAYEISYILIVSYSGLFCVLGLISAYWLSPDGWIISIFSIWISKHPNNSAISLASILSWLSLLQMFESLITIKMTGKLKIQEIIDRIGLVIVNEIIYLNSGSYIFLPGLIICVIDTLLHLAKLLEIIGLKMCLPGAGGPNSDDSQNPEKKLEKLNLIKNQFLCIFFFISSGLVTSSLFLPFIYYLSICYPEITGSFSSLPSRLKVALPLAPQAILKGLNDSFTRPSPFSTSSEESEAIGV